MAFASACDTSLGVVGSAGLSASGTFTGITNANTLSPSSVKVTWNTSSAHKTYSVYSSSSPFPLGNTIFSSFTMTGLTPATEYSFSVGGVAASGSIDGLNQVQSLTTWPQFIGLTTLTATSPISLQASWTFNDPTGSPITGPNFSVYVSQDTPPTDFTSPVASTNSTTIGITQLSDGSPILANATYFVIVRATYLDGTGEFNQNALSVKTLSNISPLPTIITDPVIIGSWPTLTVSGALASYDTSFKLVTYPNGPTGPTGGQNLGSVLGNNTFKTPSSQPIAWGQNTIIPIVTSQGSSVSLPPVTVTSRKFIDTMIDFPSFYAATGPSGNIQTHGFQRMGTAMAVGDFNCDGYQDLAIGAPYANINPNSAQAGADGGVYVYYGSSQGLITSPAPSANPTTSTAPLLLSRPNLGNGYGGLLFGYSLAAGNLNGDTNPANGKACDELAVGGYSATGEVWVYFGSTLGLQSTGAPVQQSQACSGTSCSPLQITPPPGSYSAGPYFGMSLAIGRLHQPLAGDTYRDLIVGGPYDQVPGKGRGSAWVFYGGTQGINFSTPFTKLVAPADTNPIQWSFNFGAAVAAVDMDGDGIDDIVVGAPLTNTSATCYAQGAIYYYSSHTNSVNSNGYPVTPTPTMITNPLNQPGAGCASYMRWGGYLANAGDINGDGYADLAINDGVTTNNWLWGYGSYGATVIYGGASGPQTTNGCASLKNLQGNSSPPCAINATASCGAAAGLSAGKCKMLNIPYAASSAPAVLLTNTVAGASSNGQMNDVNGDGYADIMVGWPESAGGNGARADVYYGSPNGIQASFSKITPLVANLSTDNFGMTVALGNFNSSLYSSAAAAAPDNMSLNGAYGGVVFEFNGQNGGLTSNVNSYSKLIAPNLSKEGQSNGHAVSVGDINGDGYSDVAYTFTRYDVVRPANGYFYYTEYDLVIFYGSPTGLITNPTPVFTPLHYTDPLLVPPATAVNYGSPTFYGVGAAGDVNGDGFADIIAGDSNGTAAYLYYGSSTGLQTSVLPAVPPTTGLNAVIVGGADATSNSIWNGDNWGISTNAFGTGDFNGDGYSDIILGAQAAFNTIAPPARGAAIVIYGGAQGIQTDGVLQRTLTGGPDVALSNPCSGTAPNLTCKAQLLLGGSDAYFGNSVAGVGDVNHDGFADAIVASPANNNVGVNNGAVYLYMGSPTGLLMWDATHQTYNASASATTGLLVTPPLLPGDTTGRYFSYSIAPAGDVNGDGFADFMVGAIYETASVGGAYLFYGCGNGLNNSAPTAGCPATGLWGIPVPPALVPLSSLVVNGPSCTATSCSPLYFYPNQASVASITGGWGGFYWGRHGGGVGDVNKDGFSDVVISTDFYVYQSCTSTACPSNAILAGGAVLFTGSPTGLTVNLPVTRTPSCNGGTCTPYWVTPSMTNWGTAGKPSYYDYSYGMTFNNPSPADYNGDGFPDFFITSPAYMNGSQTTSYLGGMFMFE